MQISSRILVFLLVLVAAVFFLPFLGRVHLFDWDEINFAECSREMISTGDYTRVYINFQPFWEKPPLFFWMQSTAMKWFGINEFSARFPNAVCGIATLVIIFLCGKKLYGKEFGLTWALAYLGSIFPNMYFKSGIIDPWFNLFIFLSFYFFILYYWRRNDPAKEDLRYSPAFYAICSGVCMGLAMLTKGQVALMIFIAALGVYFLLNRFRVQVGWKHVIFFLLAAGLVTFTWYGYETIKNGPWFINEFLRYQYRLFTTHDAGQKGFFGYHYIVILFGCFPASVFAISSFFRANPVNTREKDFRKWMLILFWVVTILFSIVQSRIIHYSSLAWFPVTFLAAYSFYKWEKNERPYRRYTTLITGILGGLLALILIALPFVAMNLEKLIPYVSDPFARANMAADVSWSGWDSLPGFVLAIVLLAGIRRLRQKDFRAAKWIFFGGTAVVTFLSATLIVPKVERYSQGAAIDFFKERAGEDCYVHVLGYKSYAQLFYARKEKPLNPQAYNQEWLLQGRVDKPVYFVTKVHKADQYLQRPGIKELYRKNGFVFLKREIPPATLP